MTNSTQEEKVILALVERLEKQRLPRFFDLKEKVDQGETLTDSDIDFLEDVIRDAGKIEPLIERHPEWQPIAAKVVQLYQEITEKALENERNA